MSLYWKQTPTSVDFIDKATLRDYISYARKHFQPAISDEAMELLVDGSFPFLLFFFCIDLTDPIPS